MSQHEHIPSTEFEEAADELMSRTDIVAVVAIHGPGENEDEHLWAEIQGVLPKQLVSTLLMMVAMQLGEETKASQ